MPKRSLKTINEAILGSLLVQAEEAHKEFETRMETKDTNWPAFYARFIIAELEKLGYDATSRMHSL